jgi:alpha-L-fucosidase
MKIKPARLLHSLLLASTVLTGASVAKAQAPASPDSDSSDALWKARGCVADARGKWFRDAKFGAFIHFGPYSHLGGYWQGKGPYRPAEQIIGLGDHRAVIPPDQYRREVAGAFNPTNFNAREWVSAIKRAGQRYVIATTKHHDGFAMFRTATTSYNITKATPFARDVIGELAEECRRQGIKFCPYYSIGDWCANEVQAPQFQTYRDYMFAQLKELLTQYGEVPLLWFDNYWYVNDQWHNDPSHARELYSFVRSISPNTLVNDRCGRGVSSTDGDYATPENQLKGSRQSRYFEVVMTNTEDDNWGWVRTANNYRKPADLIRNLIDCTSKGGNFVLNVGPTATGELPPEHLAILDAMGLWLKVNGEAIYGCDPAPECNWPEQPGLVAYTTKNDTAIYLHVVKWPDDGNPIRFQINRGGLSQITWLDDSLSKIQSTASRENDVTIVKLSAPAQSAPYATVAKFSFTPNK